MTDLVVAEELGRAVASFRELGDVGCAEMIEARLLALRARVDVVGPLS